VLDGIVADLPPECIQEESLGIGVQQGLLVHNEMLVTCWKRPRRRWWWRRIRAVRLKGGGIVTG
jgi:hypothetical protein